MKMQRLLVTALMLGLSIAPMTSAERNDTSSRDPHETDPRLTAHDAVAPGSFLTLDDWSIIGDQPGVEFGYSVATAGDVNGDGYADVIVGAPMYDNGTDNEGAVFVFYGSPAGLSTTPDWTVGSGQKGARFGHSVGTAGDVNGDGCDDVIVGAYRYRSDGPEAGRAYVFLGSKDDGLSTSPDWTFDGAHSYAHLGISVGTAGDVNSDTYADIIVGASFYTNDQSAEGAAYVFYGSPSGPMTTPHWMVEGDQANALFGAAVGTAGDVNGDGYGDVIVGAPQHDNGETDEGAVFVFYGSDSGLSTSHNWTVDSDQAEAEFGASVGTAGDTNGDDCSDIIVGAPPIQQWSARRRGSLCLLRFAHRTERDRRLVG